MYKKSFQFMINQKAYGYHFRLGFFLFWLFAFILFCVLGQWQIFRYHAKLSFVTAYETRLHTPPVSFLTIEKSPKPFQRVEITGHYLPENTIFIQNRFYHDRVGYEVITPFLISSTKKIILIDRGWIQKPVDEKKVSEKSQSLQGYLKFLNEYQFTLGVNTLNENQHPIISQKIIPQEIEKRLSQLVYPYLLRLDENQNGAYSRDWSITNVVPERHLAYAVQWFVMALIIVIAYFCFSIERYKEN